MSSIADLIESSHRIVFFGGAGVSTESGIPDFRSASGLYATSKGGRSPEYMLSHTCLVTEPEAFFAFHRHNLVHPEARPNAAHRALAALEAAGKVSAVITQNVDGLHQLAGSRRVIELHGSVLHNTCLGCGRRYGLDIVLASDGIPRCESCGGTVRPDVVLYEEALPAEAIDAAIEQIAVADLLIVAGTSLIVYPAAGLVQFFRGRALVVVNATQTPADRMADLVLREPIGEVLAPWAPAPGASPDSTPGCS